MKRLVPSPAARTAHSLANAGTTVPYPDDSSVKDVFERQVARTPDALAVVHRDRRTTYRELNTAANRLAHRLARRGLRPGDVVGVCVARSPELVTALVAVLKCGAAYLPFDGSWPDERLRTLFDTARCGWLVTDRPDALAARFPHHELATVSTPDESVVDDPETGPGADDIAYVNFTSGSTGRPKGVPIRHRGVLRLVHGARYAVLDERTTTLHLAPISFDAATFEIWGALLNGGTCVLYPGGFVRLSELRRVVRAQAVTTVFLTTALFNALVDEDVDALGTVDTILTGGEAHSLPHVRRALAHYGPDRLVSVYGPTECTTFATYHPLRELDDDDPALPIGKPIQNTRAYVVRSGRLCDPGEVGELCLAGPGLSPGYLGAPAADGRFVDYEVDGVAERLYHTGDLVHLRADGVLVFRGRDDDQVKVNGHRVELGEVRHALGTHPGVRQAFVTTHTGGGGDRRLTAFVVTDDPTCTPAAVRAHLRRTLPDYMVPAVVEIREALPLSVHGKVDREALLASLGRSRATTP
ncbi:amino acid adenylation domain-containing protein [Saccharothrix longispora]|uniref:Amino acid adenylation domain-containing protein n=1 Tax=Saccharothrix longispora TaxID=33920 RepID=A0ABU1PTM9_9PSEU|nr:amino acid adenylation domain-containing protein [Saccharothrix longispora]MDR6594008.1 amino acid adenylation domain-containing protein [Saccharothrix longispora]